MARVVIADLNHPSLDARLRVQRDQIPVERPHVHGAVENRHAAVHPRKSEAAHRRRNRTTPFPDRPAVLQRQRGDAGRTGRDVHDVVRHNRCRFEAAGAGWLVHPDGAQAPDVLRRDLCERRKSLGAIRPGVHQPLTRLRCGVGQARRADLGPKRRERQQTQRGDDRHLLLHHPRHGSPRGFPLRLAKYVTRSSSSVAESREAYEGMNVALGSRSTIDKSAFWSTCSALV